MASLDEVRAVVAHALGVPVEKISRECAIGDLPEWNSLGHMLIVTEIERHFGIVLDSEKIMNLESVGDFSDAVRDALSSEK